MVANQREIFKYTLSGFLSAARSALQYAHKEATTKASGHVWYDGQVSARSVVKFLSGKRNVNIHERPISPATKINVSMRDNLSVSAESVSITIFRADGTIETGESVSLSPSSSPNAPEVSVTYDYFFQDWPGNEDVIALCKMYLKAVESIVADGVARGFLTPQ